MLYFAYGSNMSRALMNVRCPAARAIGPAMLESCRFVVTADGYASAIPAPGCIVHGVLWRLTPRDLAALNIYENIGGGLYRSRVLTVRKNGWRLRALVYITRPRGKGRPRPGYLELVVAAARDWKFPDAYVRALERWAPSSFSAARAAESGELA